MKKHSICLNMIVKNEAHVIKRCLESVKDYIDTWLIVDTGSNDDTIKTIEQVMKGIPGRVECRPWVDFGHNRTEALQLAQSMADYILVMDADDVFEPKASFKMPALTEECYLMPIRYSHDTGFQFSRPQLFKASLPWRYEGILHEALVCDQPYSQASIKNALIRTYSDGGRSQINIQKKYALDALVLERGLLDEPDNARYQFYLAQSYRDSNQPKKSLESYIKRVEMAGWPEEVFYSLLQIALLKEQLKMPKEDIVASYLAAWEYRPSRAEPLYHLARFLRFQDCFAQATLFAKQAASIPLSEDILFVDHSVWAWRALDELSVSAYWRKEYQTAKQAAEKALNYSQLPEEQRERIEENLKFSQQALESLQE